MADDSIIVVYVAPFLGTLLLTVGIAAGVMGGYTVVQNQFDLCGDPTIEVADAETTDQYVNRGAPSIRRIPVEELSPAERRAFFEALEAPSGEADIQGRVPHLEAFTEGVLVTYEGGTRYVTLVSLNQCLVVPRLLLPLGMVSMLVGLAGILTPPLYRRIEAFESRG